MSACKFIICLLAFFPLVAAAQTTPSAPESPAGAVKFRIATVDLGDLRTQELLEKDSPRLRELARSIQRIRPQVLLLSGLTFDMLGTPGFDGTEPAGGNAKRFVEKYLQIPQAPQLAGLRYRIFVDQPNRGVPSGLDLNRDGRVATEFPLAAATQEQALALAEYSADCWAPGDFPGQGGMALLVDERLEIRAKEIRTFRKVPWSYMEAAFLPVRDDGTPLLSKEQMEVARLSSAGHWCVPVALPNKSVVHFLCSNPTRPEKSGSNASRRNHDEIRFWADFVDEAPWIVDDDGLEGGLRRGLTFVILGNLNADPTRGEKYRDPINTVLAATRKINLGFVPAAPGGETGTSVAGLRLDYILPSKDIEVVGGGVVPWEGGTAPSEHYPVWMDVAVAGQ